MIKYRKNLFIAIFLLAAGILTTCKYDEGPLLSFKSAEKRLIGLWEITELLIDTLNYVSTYREDTMYVKFSIVKYEDMFIYIVKESASGSQLSSSVLKLEDNKKKLRFGLRRFTAYQHYTELLYELIPPIEFSNAWDIVRLKTNEFIIELFDGSKLYRLKFERLE